MSIDVPSSISPPGMAPAVPPEPVWRLSVAQYHDMIRAGILTEDDPVELLDGWLVPKTPKNPLHRIATRRTRTALEAVLPAGWYVDTQEPVRLATSEPEPDVLVARGRTEDYPDRNPGPRDLALLVEVADATLTRDRNSKKRLYAEAGIPVYWIVNLADRQVEVYTDPSGPAESPDYRQRRNFGPGEDVPVAMEGREVARIPARDLLP